jgi:hypothetical protein
VTGRYAEPPHPGRHQACGGDLALLARGDGGQAFWRWCCRLTALFCRNEGVAHARIYAQPCIIFHGSVSALTSQRHLLCHLFVQANRARSPIPCSVIAKEKYHARHLYQTFSCAITRPVVKVHLPHILVQSVVQESHSRAMKRARLPENAEDASS